MTRWLSDEEQAAWLKLAGVMLRLSTALDSQLQRDSDLTHFEYLCLAMLSETEDRTMRMSRLAGVVNASLSRLSHVIKKLEDLGWVSRRPWEQSRRVTLVTLTDAGYDVLAEAAPGHVEKVRSLVFEGLDAEDVRNLEKLAGHIVERIDQARPPRTSEWT
jgi:DNA-binding MarR family transcriptional regulator